MPTPMPGFANKINVKVGDKFKKGDHLAMKKEYFIKSARDVARSRALIILLDNVKKSHKLISLND